MAFAACLASAAAAQVPAVSLPAPEGAPQAIDFARDPLLIFMRASGPADAFLETLGRAVERHPAVEAAIADQAATAAIRLQVRAGLFPQLDAQIVSASSLARNFPDRSAVVESLQPRSRTDAGIVGDQLLFDFGATGNRIAATSARTLAARAEVERVASDTALRAVAAWYDVLAYQTLGDLARAMVARQGAILGDVRTRLAQGVGAGGDVSRAEAVLADAEARSARFDRLLAQARGRYREAFGDMPAPRLVRVAPPASAALSLDAAQALGRKSPGVAAALGRADAARRDARAARADGLPRLSAGVNASRYDILDGPDYDVRGSLVLRQSLSAGGRQRGVIDEAAARERSASFIADRVTNESERDAGIAFTDIVALARTTAALEAAYVANRRARDAYVEQFRVARGTLIELLRAERDFFDAAAAYLQGVVEGDVARYTLLARTGEILPAAGVVLTDTGRVR